MQEIACLQCELERYPKMKIFPQSLTPYSSRCAWFNILMSWEVLKRPYIIIGGILPVATIAPHTSTRILALWNDRFWRSFITPIIFVAIRTIHSRRPALCAAVSNGWVKLFFIITRFTIEIDTFIHSVPLILDTDKVLFVSWTLIIALSSVWTAFWALSCVYFDCSQGRIHT